MLFKWGEGDFWTLENQPLVWTLMKSGGGRPANIDHTLINKVSEEFTCRKSSIFNIAIAFLFSFIRYVTTEAQFQEFCLNAFLSYFSFLNLDAAWYFQTANVLSLFRENQEAGSSVRLNNAGLIERVRVTKVVILSGNAESERFWGTVWKVVQQAEKGGMWAGWTSPEKQEALCRTGRTWSESLVVQIPLQSYLTTPPGCWREEFLAQKQSKPLLDVFFWPIICYSADILWTLYFWSTKIIKCHKRLIIIQQLTFVCFILWLALCRAWLAKSGKEQKQKQSRFPEHRFFTLNTINGELCLGLANVIHWVPKS